MPTLPSSLALTTIPASSPILSADHRTNYTAVQTAVNSLITALSGGTVGQVLRATDSTTVAWASLPSVRVRHSTTQSLTSGVEATLAFDTEDFDTGAIHDPAANTKLTCAQAGVYMVFFHLDFATNATGVRYAYLRLNGATDIAGSTISAVTASATEIAATTLYNLAVSDYIELRAFQNSGGGLNVLSTASFTPVMGMVKVAG